MVEPRGVKPLPPAFQAGVLSLNYGPSLYFGSSGRTLCQDKAGPSNSCFHSTVFNQPVQLDALDGNSSDLMR